MVRFRTGLQSVHLFSSSLSALSLRFAAHLRESHAYEKPASGRVSALMSVCAWVLFIRAVARVCVSVCECACICMLYSRVCVCVRACMDAHTHTHTSVLKRQQQHRQHRNQHIPWRFLRPTRKFSSVENYRQWLRKGRSLFAGFSLNYIRVYYAACSKFFTIANNSINIWYCDCRTHPAAAAASHHRLKILHPRRVRAPVIIADTFTSAVWYILNKNT